MARYRPKVLQVLPAAESAPGVDRESNAYYGGFMRTSAMLWMPMHTSGGGRYRKGAWEFDVLGHDTTTGLSLYGKDLS